LFSSERLGRSNVTVELDISCDGFEVRPAKPGDAKAVRMLLPKLAGTAASLVAVDGRHQRVIGAAVATRAFRRQPLAGPGIAVHVIESCRRRGVGSELVEQLDAWGQAAGASALYGAQRVDLDSDEMRGWQALGFTVCETVEQHVLPFSQFEPKLAPIVDRLRERGRIPPTAQIIPLFQADLPQVLQLHLDNMGGDRGDRFWELRRRPLAKPGHHRRMRISSCVLQDAVC
jgi:GNAT superfamily N-acetyltransferase